MIRVLSETLLHDVCSLLFGYNGQVITNATMWLLLPSYRLFCFDTLVDSNNCLTVIYP